MMQHKKYNGVIIPLVTPFTEEHKVDQAHLEIILQKVIINGCHPFVMGTTGEGLSISKEEKQKVVDTLVKFKNKRACLYASVSDICMDDMVERAKKYADSGIDVVVAHLPPQYPLSSSAMLSWFEALADQSPCPVILYNILSTTHMSIPLEIIDQLSKHPNIVGLKDSERDAHRLQEAINRWKDRPDFSYFVGWAAKSYEGLRSGSDGIVPSSGNLLPQVYRRLWDTVLEGDDENGKVFQKLSDDMGKLYQQGRLLSDSLSALKAIMKANDLCEPYVLPPLKRLKDTEEKEVALNFQSFYGKIKNKLNQ